MEDKEIYYVALYKPIYLDSGVIAYKPVKIIKGDYNIEKEIFIDSETKQEYGNVNMLIPTFGRDENNLTRALENEIEKYEETDECFFAFPIREQQMLDELCDDEKIKVQDRGTLYERVVRSYLLYSIYDEEVDDNLFYLADKINSNTVYNIDVTMDILEAVSSVEDLVPNQQLLGYVAVELIEQLEEEEDVKEDSIRRTGAPKSAKDSAFKEIIHDFNPDELEDEIKSEIIGQDHVVKAIVSMMYKNKKYHELEGLKSNMLILGPSGCGKTEIVRSLSRHLDVPMVTLDASSTSASGYVGNSVTQAIKDLLSVCNGDFTRAEHGIIVIDEIDKLATIGGDGVSKGDVQDELFKMLEGDEITVAGDSYREKSFRFNPKNVTFIGVGSAQALIDQKRRDKTKTPIGFDVIPKSTVAEEEEIVVEPEDLMKFGLKPELLRRLNIIKVVKNLKKDDLVTILRDSKISNLRLYETAFKNVDNVTLVCDNALLEKIAEKATKEKAGASGLKRVVDDMLQTSVRKIRLLNGKPGELVLSCGTLQNPDNFQLYQLNGNNKIQVYPQREKVKTLKK